MSRSTMKAEPPIPTTHELNTGQFASLLSWYGANCDASDAAKFFGAYLKEQGIAYTDSGIHSFIMYSPTVGFVCRISMRGGKLPASSLRWITNKISEFQSFQPPKVFKENDRPVVEKPKVSVQDRMKEQISKCVGELEGCLDELILSEFKTAKPPIVLMREHHIKGPQAQQIINWFKKMRDEYRLASSSSDPDLREMYSNFSKPELKKLAQYCDQIMTDGLLLVKESMETRSPRKKKKRLPEQIAKSVQYQQKDEELGLKSLEPTQMVGAMYAFTYHCPSRTLTLHVADTSDGLTFTGTTVSNVNTSASLSKKLRKPEDTLKEVLNGSKSITKKLMADLTTKAGTYRERMNKDTIIVRVFK